MNTNDNYTRSEWYAPRTPSAPPAPFTAPAQQKPAKSRHTGLKIAAVSVCALLLLVASVYVFSDSFGLNLPFRVSSSDKGDSHSFTFEIPGPSEKEETEPPSFSYDALPDEYDKDYKDFFSRYYSGTLPAAPAGSSIEQGGTGSDFRIRLLSAEGREEKALKELYPSCLASVVGIRAASKGTFGYFWGTGIIMSEDGFILTNQHIIDGTDKATVILPDGTEANATLVGEDAQMDLAVLKVEASGLHAAEFGDSSGLAVGDSVFAIGNPLMDSLSGTLTNGIVSAIDRSVSNNGHPMTLIQTNVALNEGNSGGPLFNMYGQVVGVTNMKMSNPYSDVTVEGLGFAIPTTTIKAVTDQLIATGRYVRPGIGITVGAIDSEDAAHYGLPGGLYVSSVSQNSDAAAKGVREGDILTHVNGFEVRKTDDVLAIRDGMQIGDTMTLTIYRDGEILEIEIELYNLSDLY